MATRQNCWQFKKCGREPGGAKATELGVCRAATFENGTLTNGGMGGRACWGITGTLCGGKIQGSFAQKITECAACDFYRLVKREEGVGFRLMPAK